VKQFLTFAMLAFYILGISGCGDRPGSPWTTRRAAEKDDMEAQTAMGKAYDTATGVDKDYRKSLECYLKAADQVNAGAQLVEPRLQVHSTCLGLLC
jgi:TPR repeat protein